MNVFPHRGPCKCYNKDESTFFIRTGIKSFVEYDGTWPLSFAQGNKGKMNDQKYLRLKFYFQIILFS